jgi:exopolyphosphatase/guanosine-5'-triphosphate,3'-diphosphate pyrophosphatase
MEPGMVEPPLNVGVVDIGTNSMRLLITSGETEVGRWVEVTGLGRGVDRTGLLSEDATKETLEVFARFGLLMELHGVERRKAIATSASRDAANREAFFDRSAHALGVRPTLITGAEEARYAFAGAAGDMADSSRVVVSDIGGGSTEFVTREWSVSVDIGSVRLTDRILVDRPATILQLERASKHVRDLFAATSAPGAATAVGIAGTWTSLAAISSDLPGYEYGCVQGHVMDVADLDHLVGTLGGMTVEETASIPSLDPKRAPVILSGAVIAREVLHHLGMDEIKISERDTLDGVAAELLAV